MDRLRQIISEAIDNNLLRRYCGELESYVPASGIDKRPIMSDINIYQFVERFEQFAFQVKDAIMHNRIKPSTGGKSTNASANTPQPQNYSTRNRGNGGLMNQAVNFVADFADDTYNYARRAGLDGLDQVFGGVATAFKNGYNNAQNYFQSKENDKPQPQQKSQLQNKRQRPTGADLTTLFSSPQYRKLVSDTNYFQVRNLLNRVPNVVNAKNVLENIRMLISSN